MRLSLRDVQKVYLIHRRDRLRASKSYEKKLDKPNIEIVFDTVTDEILEKKTEKSAGCVCAM